MARKHEAVSWLGRGLSLAEIAERMGVSIEQLMGYLFNQVGEGGIRRSDILFAIGGETRMAVQAVKQEHGEIDRWQIRRIVTSQYPGVNAHEAWVYVTLSKPEVYLGDMYWYLYTLEKFFHVYIQSVLMKAHGGDWWRMGIPENIRAECAATRERDPEPAAEPYCYTTLIQIKEIMDRRWNLFSKVVAKRPASNKAEFLSGLTRLNQIRNRVMHASKGNPPDENDFRVIREFIAFADFGNWTSDPAAKMLVESGDLGPVQ
jgi:transcriptional regulator with XRE-family HTH domain